MCDWRINGALALFLISCVAHSQHVPEAAYQHQRYATAVYRDTFGLDAPVSALAAQIHQESLWDCDAQSPFAHGCAQFTPPTADDMCRWYPELKPCDSGDPRFAFRAQSLYMQRLQGLAESAGFDDTFIVALSAYNGGWGWVKRDQRVCRQTPGCDPSRWVGGIERHYDTRRADWAIRENRHYPKVIVARWQAMYYRDGWGDTVQIPEAWCNDQNAEICPDIQRGRFSTACAGLLRRKQ